MLEADLADTIFSVHSVYFASLIAQLQLHLGSSPVCVNFSINPFTGKFVIELSHPELSHWCMEIMNELSILVREELSVKSCIEKLYQRVILWMIKDHYEQTSPDWTVSLSFYEDEPCLLIPCLSEMYSLSGESKAIYQLLIYLSHNNMWRELATPSFSHSLVRPSLGGALSYHSVNNKMNALTEYPEDVKIGFDIDENDVKSAADDASQADWLVVLRGMCVKDGVWEPLECVQKSVVVTDLGSQDFFKQTTYCIEKLLPKLRFEALITFVNLWRNKFFDFIDGSRDTGILTVPPRSSPSRLVHPPAVGRETGLPGAQQLGDQSRPHQRNLPTFQEPNLGDSQGLSPERRLHRDVG